jgi:hypothetical protein
MERPGGAERRANSRRLLYMTLVFPLPGACTAAWFTILKADTVAHAVQLVSWRVHDAADLGDSTPDAERAGGPGPTGEREAEELFLSDNHVVAGAELFRMYCATCHGVDGGPVADALKRRLPDLTTIKMRNAGQFPYFRITRNIDGY